MDRLIAHKVGPIGFPDTRSLLALLFLSVNAFAFDEAAKDEAALPTLDDKVDRLPKQEGYFTFFPDEASGNVWLQIDKWEKDFLYANGLSSGLGSNPVGLDRGQWGNSRVVHFKRVGKRAYLIEQNLRYRAVTSDVSEREAVNDSFADSVIWAGDIVARTGDQCLVNVNSLLISDAHGVTNRLKSNNQGDYSLAKDRSFISFDRCRGFPRNTELEATVTFSSPKPGGLVSQTAADGGVFSLRLHHSLIKLPDSGYRVRRADPRVGAFRVTFADYAAPLDAPLTQHLITRHRLEKADPSKEKSPPIEPIIYYLDPGTPQPVRDALLEGARWWAAAFEDAGFVDAFQVRMLPDDADPMDVRYNVIQWVHRSTRGWSYGQSIIDPRTGEIIKGHVLLGSLRVRQDRLIVDGLTSAQPSNEPGLCRCCGIAGAGTDDALAQLDPGIDPIDVSLARLRQLSAHEVGHTLGFAHNFAASTYGDRASVMDYPAPRVKVSDDGKLDLSDAYGVGVGQWDRFVTRYVYETFPDEETETKVLADLIESARKEKLLYLSDADARPQGAAHPSANLWDNGSDPVTELQHVMKVRQIAIAQLDSNDLMKGRPLADLEMVLVPVYLHHRYQVAATAKLIGGFDYRYAAADEEGNAVEPIPVVQQRSALKELLKTLSPDTLAIPQQLLRRLPPRPFSSLDDRERFSSRTAMIFDPSTAAQVAARLTLTELLQPQRLARLASYPQPAWDLQAVLDQVVSSVWNQQTSNDGRLKEIQRIVQRALIHELIALAANVSTSDSVRAAATGKLRWIARDTSNPNTAAAALGADHLPHIREEIDRFLERPHPPTTPPTLVPPPSGSPIGR